MLVNDAVEIKHNAKKLECSPTLESVLSLKKQSLHFLLGLSEYEAKQFAKYELACKVRAKTKNHHLKNNLKIM